MLSTSLSLLQKGINRYLLMDEQAVQRLQPWQGKVMAVDISDWLVKVYVSIAAQGVALTSVQPEQVDASICATGKDLWRIASAGGDNTSLFATKLEFSGDIEFVQALRSIMQSVDIDWEEQISQCVGDTAAYHLLRLANRGRAGVKAVRTTLAQQVRDFLVYEQPALPTGQEMKQFATEVAKLRNQLDCLELRLKRMAQSPKQER